MAPVSGVATVATVKGLHKHTRKVNMKKVKKDSGFLGISGLDKPTRNALYADAKRASRSLSAHVVRILRDSVTGTNAT